VNGIISDVNECDGDERVAELADGCRRLLLEKGFFQVPWLCALWSQVEADCPIEDIAQTNRSLRLL